MIKAIIFDIGRVILTFDNEIFLNRAVKYSGISIDEMRDFIFCENGPEIRYETGMLTSDEYFDLLVKMCKLSVSKEQFIQDFVDQYTLIDSTMEIIKKLKGNYKLGLLSNTNELQHLYGWSKLGFHTLFDTMTLSYQVKAFKPDPKIYEDALKKLDCNPDEVIYIDDIEEYTAEASKLGLNVVWYTGKKSLVFGLKRFGVEL